MKDSNFRTGAFWLSTAFLCGAAFVPSCSSGSGGTGGTTSAGTTSSGQGGQASTSGSGGSTTTSSASSSSTMISSSSNTSSGGSGGSGGAGDVIPPECAMPGDCPGIDSECRSRTCAAGKCGVSFVAAGTPLAAQVPGDCATAICDGAGDVASVPAPSDVADDGNECTDDACNGQTPTHTPKPIGSSCLSACPCPPCVQALNPCKQGMCGGAGVCEAYLPVVCKVADGSFQLCDGVEHVGNYTIAIYSGNVIIDTCTGAQSQGQYVSAYCAPGTKCSVVWNGAYLGMGTCQ